MIVSTVRHFGKWAVEIAQGCQTFYMEKENREEARWYTKMFKIAIEKNNEEVRNKCLSARKES